MPSRIRECECSSMRVNTSLNITGSWYMTVLHLFTNMIALDEFGNVVNLVVDCRLFLTYVKRDYAQIIENKHKSKEVVLKYSLPIVVNARSITIDCFSASIFCLHRL